MMIQSFRSDLTSRLLLLGLCLAANLWNTPAFLAPYTVAVRSGEEANITLNVFDCPNNDNGWCEAPRQFVGHDAYDLSDNGQTLALAESPHNFTGSMPAIHIFSEVHGAENVSFQVVEPLYPDSDDSPMLLQRVTSISLSRDGKTMAVQTTTQDMMSNLAVCESDCEKKWVSNSVIGTIGTDKTSTLLMQSKVHDNMHSRPIEISGDANVVAFASWSCSEPMAHVFEWNGTDWNRRSAPLPKFGQDVCPDDTEASFYPVTLSLSERGNSLAVGYRGRAFVYDYDGFGYKQVGELYPETSWGTNTKAAVALSDDATILAVGSPGTDDVSNGFVQVYETGSRLPYCSDDEKLLHFSLSTDGYPELLSWSLFDNSTKSTTASVPLGYYTYSEATYLHEICISGSHCTVLTVTDSGNRAFSSTTDRIDLLLDNEPVWDSYIKGAAKRIFLGDNCL